MKLPKNPTVWDVINEEFLKPIRMKPWEFGKEYSFSMEELILIMGNSPERVKDFASRLADVFGNSKEFWENFHRQNQERERERKKRMNFRELLKVKELKRFWQEVEFRANEDVDTFFFREEHLDFRDENGNNIGHVKYKTYNVPEMFWRDLFSLLAIPSSVALPMIREELGIGKAEPKIGVWTTPPDEKTIIIIDEPGHLSQEKLDLLLENFKGINIKRVDNV